MTRFYDAGEISSGAIELLREIEENPKFGIVVHEPDSEVSELVSAGYVTLRPDHEISHSRKNALGPGWVRAISRRTAS